MSQKLNSGNMKNHLKGPKIGGQIS